MLTPQANPRLLDTRIFSVGEHPFRLTLDACILAL
jgi:hypothetical protein